MTAVDLAPATVARRLEALAQLVSLGESLRQARGHVLSPRQLADRGLHVCGLASPALATGLLLDPTRELAVVVAPAGSTHHVGREYSTLLRPESPAGAVSVHAILVASATLGGRRADSIPPNQTAIAVLRFPSGPPRVLRELAVDDRGAPIWMLGDARDLELL